MEVSHEEFAREVAEKAMQVARGSIVEGLQRICANLQAADNVPQENKPSLEKLIEMWNTLNAEVLRVSLADLPKQKAASTRAKTDPGKTCQVPKQRGPHAGEPCGNKCVLGSDTCSAHKNSTASGAPSTPSAVSSAPSSEGVPSVPVSVPVSAPVPSAAPSGGCEHVLVAGPRKGMTCSAKCKEGNTRCTVHLKKLAAA